MSSEPMEHQDEACKATPRKELMERLMDPHVAKTELEHFAAHIIKEHDQDINTLSNSKSVKRYDVIYDRRDKTLRHDLYKDGFWVPFTVYEQDVNALENRCSVNKQDISMLENRCVQLEEIVFGRTQLSKSQERKVEINEKTIHEQSSIISELKEDVKYLGSKLDMKTAVLDVAKESITEQIATISRLRWKAEELMDGQDKQFEQALKAKKETEKVNATNERLRETIKEYQEAIERFYKLATGEDIGMGITPDIVYQDIRDAIKGKKSNG